MTLDGRIPVGPIADVCVHAGDLTEESKLEEFRSAITLLRSIDAPLKLVIAGNHDFTLDTPSFAKKIQEIKPPLDPALVKKFYGDYEEAKHLLLNAREEHGIYLLNEGTHDFVLQNGGKLRVYASPYTPSLGDWGFQYRPNDGHNFVIEAGTNIVVTHGPPRGILDRTNNRERAGCADLFAAVAKAKPQIHCFGHIHEGWGARMVAWRGTLSEKPSFLTDIDNSASLLVEQLGTLHESNFDSPEDVDAKKKKLNKYTLQKYCTASVVSVNKADHGKKTLFVNASIKGDSPDAELQLPWLVDVMLPRESDNGDLAAPSRKDKAAASNDDPDPKGITTTYDSDFDPKGITTTYDDDFDPKGITAAYDGDFDPKGITAASDGDPDPKCIAAASDSDSSPGSSSQNGPREGRQNQGLGMANESAQGDRRKFSMEGGWYTKKTAGKKRPLEMEDQAEGTKLKSRRRLPGDKR